MDDRKEAQLRGCESYSKRATEVREIIFRNNENAAWDHIQSRDIDPKILDFVADRIHAGKTPGEISIELGLSQFGGKNSRQFRKIMAYFNQGFRVDMTSYAIQILHKAHKINQKIEAILEDAIENGVPVVVTTPEAPPEIIMVKGATKELGSFLESYNKSILMPIKALKDIGAIGDKPGSAAANSGVTIVVENNIPMPSVDEIKAHQEEMRAKARAIEVRPAGESDASTSQD